MQNAILAATQRFLTMTVLDQMTPATRYPPLEQQSEQNLEPNPTPDDLPPPSYPQSLPSPTRFEKQLALIIYETTLTKFERIESEFTKGKSLAEIRKSSLARKKRRKTLLSSADLLPGSTNAVTYAPPSFLDAISVRRNDERKRWCGLLIVSLLVPFPVAAAMLMLEAVRLGAWPGSRWEEDVWDAVVEVLWMG
jgi:hypothetical protein